MNKTKSPWRLAVVLSHPTQYYSPWFRQLAGKLELRVFYLWDFGVRESRDRNFGESFQWDVPLLEGYDHQFLENRSKDPGTHHFRGLDNPSAVSCIEDWAPDAILLFGYNYRTQLGLLLSRRLGSIPILFRGDSHELAPAVGWKSKLGRGVRRFLFRRMAAFLAVGKANADYFRACRVDEARIARVPHCVDNDRFQGTRDRATDEATLWKQELGIPEKVPVILFAGKFEPKKRPLDLLEAFIRLREDQDDRSSPVLLFVGSGVLEEELRKRVGDRLGDSVFFAGFQNQSQMPKVYRTGNVLVLPSWEETWGLAINEAFNMGVPAIVSSHVGCGPDLVANEVTGWVFEAGNVEALSQTLREATAKGVEGLAEMGLDARERIDGYSYQVASDAVLEVMKRFHC